MKFILAEDKFILDESFGFVLEERFNLDEDILLEAQATLKQLVIDLNKLDTLLPDLLTALPTGLSLKILDGTPLEGETVDVEKEIQANCTEIQNLLKDKKNFKALIDKIRAKAMLAENSFTEDEVKILQPLCYSIASNGNSVKDRLKGIKSHKGELAEQVATLQTRLPQLKTDIEKLYQFFEEKTPDDTTEDPVPEEPKIKYSLKESELELKVGETTTLKILATPKPEGPVKATFESASKETATVSNTGEIKAIAKGVTEIKVTVADQTLTCKVTVTEAASEEPPVATEELDWYELYKKCSECENVKEANKAFWRGGLPKKGEPNPNKLPEAPTDVAALGYYKGEWGDKSEIVASLGTPFMNTLKKIGWTETLNPFVGLLKHLFKFTDLKFTDASFTAILTAYDNGLINEADLRGGEKGKLGELNLVRNPQLYSKSVAEITDYLTWQKEVKTAETKIPASSNIKVVYANIVDANGKVEDVTGDAEDLVDETAYNTISTKSFRYDIRPLVKYKEIIKTKLGVDGDKPKAAKATDSDVTNIIAQIKDADTAKKFLAYLLNYYRVAKLEVLTALLKNSFGNTLVTNRNNTATTFEEDKHFDNLLQVKSKRYSTKQVTTLVSEVLKIAGLTT